MKEERMQILRMIQEGIVSPEEGAKLIAALGTDATEQAQATASASSHQYFHAPMQPRRWLRIRVTDKEQNRTRVNLSLPLSLLEWGLNMAESNGGVNLAAIRAALHGGAEGKILEIDESSSNERVEIFVE